MLIIKINILQEVLQMKKDKSKKTRKDRGYNVMKAIIWSMGILFVILIITTTILNLMDTEASIYSNLFFVFLTIFILTMLFSLIKEVKIRKKVKNLSNDKKELRILENQYGVYVDLVDKQVSKILKIVKKRDQTTYRQLIENVDCNFLYVFKEQLSQMETSYIDKGIWKMDSCAIASCLFYALLSNPVLKSIDSSRDDYLDAINFCIALTSTFEIFQKHASYYKDCNGVWQEQKNSLDENSQNQYDDDLFKVLCDLISYAVKTYGTKYPYHFVVNTTLLLRMNEFVVCQ